MDNVLPVLRLLEAEGCTEFHFSTKHDWVQGRAYPQPGVQLAIDVNSPVPGSKGIWRMCWEQPNCGEVAVAANTRDDAKQALRQALQDRYEAAKAEWAPLAAYLEKV